MTTTVKVITAALHRGQRGHGKGFVAKPSPRLVAVHRPARVAVMLALAHAIRAAIHAGQVTDQADVARRLGFTPARVTQLLDLLQLAPDLQERVLFLEAVDGIEPLAERQLRSLVRLRSWEVQRETLSLIEGRVSRSSGASRARSLRSAPVLRPTQVAGLPPRR